MNSNEFNENLKTVETFLLNVYDEAGQEAVRSAIESKNINKLGEMLVDIRDVCDDLMKSIGYVNEDRSVFDYI